MISSKPGNEAEKQPNLRPMIDWVTPNWPPIEGLQALTSCRQGGVSGSQRSGLNLAGHVGDDPTNVTENRRRLTSQAGLPTQPYWLDQRHDNRVVNYQTTVKNKPLPAADGCFSDQPNQVCAILTADCLPILIRSSDGRQLAAVHAGWRGLHKGVIASALKQFNRTPTIAWIGPAISPEAYQVDDLLRTNFIDLNRDYEASFKPVSPGQWQMDLIAIATHQLQAHGVDQVYTSGICCYQDQRFYSHRRDPDCGRMATLIWRDSTTD